jgi:hypothetical protein
MNGDSTHSTGRAWLVLLALGAIALVVVVALLSAGGGGGGGGY